MLLSLSLSDFVIVDRLDLNFETGFTVLTGETGAGKSITLDAVALLLGGKADYGMIRHGASEARLSALFDITGLPALQNELHEAGFLSEGENELSLRRIIDIKGKSRSFINGQAATLAQLKQTGSRLIDIHGQNAHQSLNQEAARRHLLDAFAGTLPLAAEVRAARQQYLTAAAALSNAREAAGRLDLERERLEWQAGELDKLRPVAGEWEELERSHDSLAHAAELLEAAAHCEELLDGDNGAARQIYRCQKQLAGLVRFEPRFEEALQLLAAVEAEIDETVSLLREAAGRTEADPSALAHAEQRMAELMGAARKYRINPEALPAKLAETRQALEALNQSADIEALQQAAEAAEAAFLDPARRLTALRSEAAGRLSAEVCGNLAELAMKGAQFQIELQPAEPGSHGLEHIEFLVAANPGSAPRPLSKTASGGELARISLALQMAAGRHNSLPTLIFDEVDTGIGGATAETVGKALRRLGEDRQILAVTHLAQVAACGQRHWQVSKHSSGGQTVSEIKLLDNAGRTAEIARMLGGETVTETALNHAREMLAGAGNPVL